MDAIELIRNRTSCAHLAEPKPDKKQLDTLYQAAFRAADHRQLKPVRFLEISGDGLHRLGELFVRGKEAATPELTSEAREKARLSPTRAPMIIAIIACLQEDPKVPEVEQILSVGASVQNMLNAAYALGLGTIWRTGDLAFNPLVAEGLGLASHERLLGFIYIGTPRVPFREAPAYNYEKHIKRWP